MKGIELFEEEGTAEVEGSNADLEKALGEGALDDIEMRRASRAQWLQCPLSQLSI